MNELRGEAPDVCSLQDKVPEKLTRGKLYSKETKCHCWAGWVLSELGVSNEEMEYFNSNQYEAADRIAEELGFNPNTKYVGDSHFYTVRGAVLGGIESNDNKKTYVARHEAAVKSTAELCRVVKEAKGN